MKSQIRSLLQKLDIPYRWVDHPAVFTVEDSMKCIEGKEPIKNLLLQDKSGQYYLVIIAGNKKLDMKNLASKIGCRKLQFAKPEHLKDLLGVTPGAVSLFGLINEVNNQVKLIIEKDLLKAKELGFHPNDNTSTIFINSIHFEKIARGLRHEINLIDI